jgi:hypothetical protein
MHHHHHQVRKLENELIYGARDPQDSRVDAPDHPLHKDLVLVQRQQRAYIIIIIIKSVSFVFNISKQFLLPLQGRRNSPSVPGVSFWNMIELVGLLPSKTLLLANDSLEAAAPSS